MEEKRKGKRLDLQANIVLKSMGTSEDRAVRIEVLDLSKFGIGFICSEMLEQGSLYETDIKIWTGDTIHAFIEIVRISEQEGGNIYGGTFVGMPESDWCRIRVYETYQDFNPAKE